MKLIKSDNNYYYLMDESLIIGSTQNTIPNSNKLSLSNCQAIEQGFDLDKLAKEFQDVLLDNGWRESPSQKIAFIKGFQKALEIFSDKNFSEVDMFSFVEYCLDNIELSSLPSENLFKSWKSLQQLNEWEVEIIMIQGFDDINNPKPFSVPYTDKDGCIILKRKQNDKLELV